ncbi:MuF-C-terminal domain-containing protein [Thalassovita litoralis]|uniref:MuF-C-terminal domain-containing protein n=1 Tax=Thalassovita litoralis TaxID=1010611 RepID=UPI00163D6857|nr:hypothetical protein [Thalassovita litoralis]
MAELYRNSRDAWADTGLVGTALRKIQQFFEALGNGFKGQGFLSAGQVMERIANGTVGGRGPDGGASANRDARSESEMVGVSRKSWQSMLVRLLQGDKTLSPDLLVGKVGPILSGIGVPTGRIYMRGSKIQTVLKKHKDAHEAIMRLPELLDDPEVVIQQNRQDSDYRIVTSARTAAGHPIIANLKVEGETSRGQPGRIVMTVYGWNDAERGLSNAIRAGKLAYMRDESVVLRLLGSKGDAPLNLS